MPGQIEPLAFVSATTCSGSLSRIGSSLKFAVKGWIYIWNAMKRKAMPISCFHTMRLWNWSFLRKNLCFLKILPVFFVQGEQFIQGHLHMVVLTAPSFRVHQARCVRWKSPCLPCVYHNMLMILWVYYIYRCFIYLIWCGGKVALSKLYRSVSVQTELIFIQLKGRKMERNTSWTTLILVIHGGIGLLPYRDLTIWEQHKATTQGCSRGWYDWYLYVLCGHPGVYAFHCSTGLKIGHVIFGEWENGKPSSKTPTLGKKRLCMSIDRRPLKLFWSIDTSNFGNRMKVGRAIACLCIHGIVDVWKCHNAVNCNHMAILCNILF